MVCALTRLKLKWSPLDLSAARWRFSNCWIPASVERDGEMREMRIVGGWQGCDVAGRAADAAGRSAEHVHPASTVVRGRGKVIVTATVADSSVGQLAIDVLGAPPGRPPLLERLDHFSRVIGIASVAAAAIVAVLGILVHGYTIAAWRSSAWR
jgi:hypothetical protein